MTPELSSWSGPCSAQDVLQGAARKSYGYDVKVKYILGKESLEARLRLASLSTAVGIASASLLEADVCTTQSAMEQQRHDLFMRAKIHTLTKVALAYSGGFG